MSSSANRSEMRMRTACPCEPCVQGIARSPASNRAATSRYTAILAVFSVPFRRTKTVVDRPQSALSRRGVLISRQVAEHPRGSKRAILLLFCVRPIYATSRRHLVCGPYTNSNDRNKSRHLQRERLYRVLSTAVSPARIDVGGSQQILACRTWLS